MAGKLPSARATRTFSRAVAGSSPIRQDNQCAHDTAPCGSHPHSASNTFEQPVRGRIQVNRQFRYLLTQFLDGKHGQYYTNVQLLLQWELDAISSHEAVTESSQSCNTPAA
jgi:hypothetical protein